MVEWIRSILSFDTKKKDRQISSSFSMHSMQIDFVLSLFLFSVFFPLIPQCLVMANVINFLLKNKNKITDLDVGHATKIIVI